MCNQAAIAAIDHAAEQLSPPQTFPVAAPIIFARGQAPWRAQPGSRVTARPGRARSNLIVSGNGISWPESDPLFK